MGIGISAKIAFGAIHGIIPVALFTLGAVRTIKPILIKTGRVLKLSPTVMVREILFPAAVPEIFTGIRVGFSLTLIGTVLGEMFAAQRGLGYLLMNAISLYNIDLIMAVTFLLVLLAASVNTLLLAIDRRLHHAARLHEYFFSRSFHFCKSSASARLFSAISCSPSLKALSLPRSQLARGAAGHFRSPSPRAR